MYMEYNIVVNQPAECSGVECSLIQWGGLNSSSSSGLGIVNKNDATEYGARRTEAKESREVNT